MSNFFNYESANIDNDFHANKDIYQGFLDDHVNRLVDANAGTSMFRGVDVGGTNPIVEELSDIVFDVDEEDVQDFTREAASSSTLAKCYLIAAGFLPAVLSNDPDPAVRDMVAYQGEELDVLIEDSDKSVAETAEMMMGFREENKWLKNPIVFVRDPNRIIVSNGGKLEYIPAIGGQKASESVPRWLKESLGSIRTPEGRKAVRIAVKRGLLPDGLLIQEW